MIQALLKKYWFPLVVLVLIVVLAILVNRYREKAIEYKKQRDEKTQALSLANATINDMQVRQRDVATLDAKYTKELADANAENDALRKRLDNGGRVRVQGKCPAQDYTTSTGSMGDAGTVELSDVAGRNVLGIRAGIIRDQQALKYLQDYINTQCLK
ncbi:lysis protein [Salmonella enterica subsp. enterica serovar Uganda]|nr:lysis protein [Salmonella enterica]EAN1474755.1 lysis protein [Salmonella enterica subsp. enterica serovar Uganda]EJJ1489242.1 lysis protein [Salmonella enterica subsp. enterica]EAN5976554.1 lysis protein [Salmonella enterica]EAN9697465.1 lysis protein [Salmonella enterica]